MDIKQAVDACAAVTLGKDMVFRDYAQGTFRMRGINIQLIYMYIHRFHTFLGIGKGQTLKLLLVPEIVERIKTQVNFISMKLFY